MALRLLRLVPATASARGPAAGVQRVVSGGRLLLLGSRPVGSAPRRPGIAGQTPAPRAPEAPAAAPGSLSRRHSRNRDAGALEPGYPLARPFSDWRSCFVERPVVVT